MLHDFPDARPILATEVTYRGRVWEIVRDSISFGGEKFVRDYVRHPGAVAIVAINHQNEVLLINQYRHPVGQTMLEIPAGMLDKAAENPLEAAKRELLEESGYIASKWETLIDMCTTPGSSSEAIRIFLAQDLDFAPDPDYVRHSEETEIVVRFVPIPAVVEAIYTGQIQSPTAIAGVLALHGLGNRSPRSAISAWPIRDHLLAQKRVFEF